MTDAPTPAQQVEAGLRWIVDQYGPPRRWPRLPWAFGWVLAVHQAAWAQHRGDLEEQAVPYVGAVATVLGVDVDALWDRVENPQGVHQPAPVAYEQEVWSAARCTGCPPLPPRRDRFAPKPQVLHHLGHPWLLPRTPAPGLTARQDGTIAGTPQAGPGSLTLSGDYLTGPWRYMGRRH